MIPTLLDLTTGARAEPTIDFDVYWWTEGNGSCDCNRMLAFSDAVAEEMKKAQRAEHPELKEWQGVCYGCKRFIAIGVRGDLEGRTEREIVRAMNDEYLV